MDPITALDMKYRSKVSPDEVDEFVTRMDMIEEAMKQIKDGTFDPYTCKIPGYKTPEQEELERQEKAKREKERQERERQRLAKEKQEEKDSWWEKAHLQFSWKSGDTEIEQEDAINSNLSSAVKWANRVIAAYKERDANDYSIWNQWEPEDPVSKEEQAAREKELEKLRNQEFEKNNPEFCQEFKADLENRQQSNREKERASEKLKNQGNKLFKRREYRKAIQEYMKALKVTPFNVNVLTNLAQAHWKINCYEDSLEFSTRALYLSPTHVKALCRRAAIYHHQNELHKAAEDMRQALSIEPTNVDIQEQHSIVVGDYQDSKLKQTLYDSINNPQGSEASTWSPRKAELLIAAELLEKISTNCDDKWSFCNQETPNITQEDIESSLVPYELLIPFLRDNDQVKAWFRTSGGMNKLGKVLVNILQLLQLNGNSSSLIMTEITCINSNGMLGKYEPIVVVLINVFSSAFSNCQRNQVVMFRDKEFRNQVTNIFESMEKFILLFAIKTLTYKQTLQFAIFSLLDVLMEFKTWRQSIIANELICSNLLSLLIKLPQCECKNEVLLQFLNVVYTVSGEAIGVKTLSTGALEWQHGLSLLLRSKQDSSTYETLLGIVVNFSTHQVFRSSLNKLDSKTSEIRFSLLNSLLSFCVPRGSCGSSENCSVQERALASLLNYTYQESACRHDLAFDQQLDGVSKIDSMLAYSLKKAGDSGCTLIVSHALGLLCRLHTSSNSDPEVFRDLYEKLQSLSIIRSTYGAATQFVAVYSEDHWQMLANAWTHLAWIASISSIGKVDLLQIIDLTAILRVVHCIIMRLNVEEKSSPRQSSLGERTVGNIGKLLIGIVDSVTWNISKKELEILVSALQKLPDGSARKNIAVVLAKLCQKDENTKEIIRSLRGIEMMVAISKLLSK